MDWYWKAHVEFKRRPETRGYRNYTLCLRWRRRRYVVVRLAFEIGTDRASLGRSVINEEEVLVVSRSKGNDSLLVVILLAFLTSVCSTATAAAKVVTVA